jgi:ketosteroid isomerase-like protein
MTRTSLLSGLVACLCACSEPSGANPAASQSATSAVAATGSADRSASSPGPAIDEKAVRALVDDWVAAQNKGDFASYEKLYAAKLEGIKRSGPRTWRFDRKGFLEDRERMFKKPMTVEVGEVTVTPGAASALVELEQRFKQDRFEDKGPKRLVVIEEKGALKIAREEMVQSVLAGSRPSAKSAFRFVVDIADKPHVILDQEADASWASAPAAWAPRRGAHPDFLVVRPAGSAPAGAKAWKGRVLKVYDATGATCDVTVNDIAVMAGGTPHFGEVQRWDGDPDPDGKLQSPKLSLAQRAAYVFGMASPYLVGAIDVPKGCVAAFALEGKSPTFYKPGAAPADDDAAVKAAKAAFRDLPSYRDNQKAFETSFSGKGDWAPKVDVEAFEGNGRRFLALQANVVAGCAEFNGTTTALFEVTSQNRVALVAEGIGDPSSLFDSDGDGAIELYAQSLYDDGIGRYIVTGPSGIASEQVLDFPNNDCGC